MKLKGRELVLIAACLMALVLFALGAVLAYLKPVMVPFVLALFLTVGLTPVIDGLMHRLKVPHLVAVFLTMILAAGFVFLVGSLVVTSFAQLGDNLPAYKERITELAEQVNDKLPLERMGVDADKITQDAADGAADMAKRTVGQLFNIASKSILVGIFTLFLLLGKGADSKPPTGVWADIQGRIKTYLVTKFLVSGLTGFLTGITLALLGVDLALVFGVMAFLLNFIPSVGSIVAVFLPLPVILVTPDMTLATATMALAIPGAIQFTLGSVIEPKMLGESLDLHPVVIVMSLIFWGMLWGIPGMLMAAPLAAMFKIMLEQLDITKPLAEILAGRGAAAGEELVIPGLEPTQTMQALSEEELARATAEATGDEVTPPEA